MSDPMLQVPASVVIDGGVSVNVLKLDGTTEAVKVKLVPFRDGAKYLELTAEPSALIDWACGKPVGWSDTLHPDSFFALDEKIRELNDPHIDRWLARQAKVVESMKAKMARLSGPTSSQPTQ